MIDIKEILKLAKEKGFGEPEICKITGKHKCTVWRWESGKTKPRAKTLAKLITAVNS
jgi:transcriptional regulator with XRE-family HTH domain